MSKITLLYVHAISMLAAEKRDEEGATATEYAMLVAGICIALLAAVGIFGTQLSAFFSGLGAKVGIAP